MASLLNLVKHYQNDIENYHDEKNILKCIEALSGLDVTVQHLQETGVGRTVNALRKESGKVGLAARSLVNKWKAMVVAEDSDQDGGHQYTTNYNGSGKDSDDNIQQSRSKSDRSEKSSTTQKLSQKEHSTQVNGNHSGGKRKYSTEEEPHDTKKSNISNDDYYKKKSDIKTKRKYSESDSYDSQSESDGSESYSSEEEVKIKQEIKEEIPDKPKSSKQSSHSHHASQKNDSYSSKESTHSLDKHSEYYSSQSKERYDSDKYSSKEVSHNSHKHKSAKDNESSTEKKHKSENKSPNIDKSHKDSKHSNKSSSNEKHKSSSSSSHKDEKYKTSSDKQSSKSDKHKSSGEPEKKEKQKSTSESETSKHRSKDKTGSSNIKEKHDSSIKEKSKNRDRSSLSKEKANSHSGSEKRHSSSNVKSDRSSSKSNSDKSSDHSSDKKSKHKSSSSDSKSSKSSSSSKTKEDLPKKKIRLNEEDSEDGIDCGSGASFAEALGMISPTKPKKKYSNGKDTQSPTNTFMNDLSPAALLAPSAKLAPLPALEISALPEISPYYKPRPPPKCLPHFTDEEAISVGISTKNQRTKVYSGNKVLGKVPTLYEMCVDILQEHIDALEYTGGVPYEILKPVVDRATPQQLFTLEHYNPYLMEDTDHLWQKFCEKNFRKQQRQEFEAWREMYLRCQEEQEYRLKSLTANIKIAQEAKKAPIKQTKMAYVDTVVKPPRSIARKQAQHGTAHASTASPAARVAALASAANVLKPGSVRPPPATAVSSTAFQKPKKAPLMQKALQFMRGRKR